MFSFDDIIMNSSFSTDFVCHEDSDYSNRRVEIFHVNLPAAIQVLPHWGIEKMAAIYQTTFSEAFYWMKIYKFQLGLTEICSQGSN